MMKKGAVFLSALAVLAVCLVSLPGITKNEGVFAPVFRDRVFVQKAVPEGYLSLYISDSDSDPGRFAFLTDTIVETAAEARAGDYGELRYAVTWCTPDYIMSEDGREIVDITVNPQERVDVVMVYDDYIVVNGRAFISGGAAAETLTEALELCFAPSSAAFLGEPELRESLVY